MLKVLDLFSGIGGFSLGLERTGGFETVAFCEIDEFPRRVLAKHWPEVPCYHDVTKLTADILRRDRIGPIDVITGGFPCQDASQAAYSHGRAGIGGARTSLYREAVRLIGELGPSWVILENVRGLLTDGLIPVLQGLSQVGYDAEWHCIPASAVGSIQNRDRVWIIANPRKERSKGLFQGRGIGPTGQGRACRQADLLKVYAEPLKANSWPQPIIRRGNERPANWVDRIAACGNCADPAIPELIGNAILQGEGETC